MASIARSGLDKNGNTVWWFESVFRTDSDVPFEGETDEQRISQLTAKIRWAIEDCVYAKVNLYRPHEKEARGQLTETLRQIWQQHQAEFECELEPYVNADNIDKMAYHIFNLYRIQILLPVLQEFKRNPSIVKLSKDNWDQWQTRVTKWTWHSFKRTYFESIAEAMGPLLSELFSGKVPPNYVPNLYTPHQGQGLPKLRLKLEAKAFN